MRHISLALAMVACLVIGGSVLGNDSIRLSGGKTVSGKITGMSSRQVTVKSRGKTKPLPVNVNEIVSITFDGAPRSLSLARLAAGNGRYEDALNILDKIKTDEIKRDLVKQDVAFYKAMCAARLALAGSGELQSVGKQMNDFVRFYPKNYHWLEANELVGDLLVANKSFGLAAGYYDQLAKTPWPDYRMRAQVAIGQAKLAEGKTQEASRAFDSVLAMKVSGQAASGQAVSGKAAETQKLYARLGKALCLAGENETDEAVELVQEIILAGGPEESRLMAKAYNALGTSLRKAGRPNDALLAFLHVDVLYFSSAEEHAEALANLAELWSEVHKPRRAVEARQTLENRYKNSRWATQ